MLLADDISRSIVLFHNAISLSLKHCTWCTVAVQKSTKGPYRPLLSATCTILRGRTRSSNPSIRVIGRAPIPRHEKIKGTARCNRAGEGEERNLAIGSRAFESWELCMIPTIQVLQTDDDAMLTVPVIHNVKRLTALFDGRKASPAF
jgi:hypothetical protein